VFANKTVGQVVDHYAAVIDLLDQKPAIIGHSFGGLIAMILAADCPPSRSRSTRHRSAGYCRFRSPR
jgi:pimeloyl-ACP methyl ester carboxylesterase